MPRIFDNIEEYLSEALRHILTTFPLVDESIKTATLNEFMKLEK